MNFKISIKNIRTNINLLILTLMYAAGSLGVVNQEILSPNIALLLKYTIIILGTLYFISEFVRKYSLGNGDVLIPFKTRNWGLLFLWLAFSVVVIISQSYSNEFPFEGIAYLIFNTIVFFIIIPMTLKNPVSIIIKASFYASFSYLIISMLYEPIVFGSYYTGITYNPNSIGQLSVQAAISSFCIFLNAVENASIRKEKWRSFIYFILFIVSVAFVLLSNSRTSFFALLVPCICTILMFVWAKKIRLRYLIVPSLIFVLIYFVSLREYFEVGILDKFNRYNNDSLLSGRDIIWNRIIDDISLLGYGTKYFNDVIGIGAHNSILEVVGKFGVIAGILISLIYITSIMISIKYGIINRSLDYFYLPIIVTMTFFILSMTESMFGVIGKSMTLVFFNILGLLMIKKTHNE